MNNKKKWIKKMITKRLPIDSDDLTSSCPIAMRLVICWVDTGALGIGTNKVALIMFDQIASVRFEHTIDGVFWKRENMLRCIFHARFDPMAFHTNGVNEKRGQTEGHLPFGFFFCWNWFPFPAKSLPSLFDVGNSLFQQSFRVVIRRRSGRRRSGFNGCRLFNLLCCSALGSPLGLKSRQLVYNIQIFGLSECICQI